MNSAAAPNNAIESDAAPLSTSVGRRPFVTQHHPVSEESGKVKLRTQTVIPDVGAVS